jgi:hypothetical protein
MNEQRTTPTPMPAAFWFCVGLLVGIFIGSLLPNPIVGKRKAAASELDKFLLQCAPGTVRPWGTGVTCQSNPKPAPPEAPEEK